MSCFRPAYPDLNLQNVQDPPASSPFQTPPAATDARQKPSTPDAEKNKKNRTKGSVENHKTFIIRPETSVGIKLRLDGGAMWGLPLVIRAAGAAAGRASAPPWICCSSSCCQTDQISTEATVACEAAAKDTRA